MSYCVVCKHITTRHGGQGDGYACLVYPLSDLERVMRQHPGKCPSYAQEE